MIHHHPETAVRRLDLNGGTAVLLGEGFAHGEPVDAVLAGLLTAPDDDAFFDRFEALGGRFALLVLKGSTQRLLHDAIGSRTVYYAARGEPCVASHSELVARAFGHGRSAEVAAILASDEYRSRSVRYLPGDLTVYEGVHGLAPNSYYDLGSGRTVRYWPRSARRATTFDDFAAALDGHLDALAAHLRDRHEPVLGITGGIDTRTLIAAFARHGLRFRGVTWVRRSSDLDPRERAVVDALVAACGCEHRYLDLDRLDGDARRVARLAKRNAGGFGTRSRITAHMTPLFGAAGAAFVRGYGAEILRGFYNLPAGSSAARARRGWRARLGRALGRGGTRPVALAEPTPAEMLKAYDSSMRVERAGAEHTARGLAAFEGFAERASFDGRLTRFGFDPSDLFYWEHRMGMWASANHNEMDPALLSVAGFNSRRVYEAAFGLEPKERLTKELLLRVIDRYDEQLARIPYL